MAKEGGKRAGEGVHGGGLRFRVLGGSLPPLRRGDASLVFMCLAYRPPPKPALNLEALPNRLGLCLLLPAPEAQPPPLPCSCLLPASPPFNLLPHWRPAPFLGPLSRSSR